jgi:hypothetical protein
MSGCTYLQDAYCEVKKPDVLGHWSMTDYVVDNILCSMSD